jgi:hypothetical protein
METRLHATGFESRVWKNICYAASRLVRRDAVPGMSVEDYRQELALDLARRNPCYDRTKACYPTFADRVIRHHAANLSAPSVRKRKERRHLSLNAVLRDDDAGEVELHELIADDMPPVDEIVAARIDVRRFVDRLPDHHQQCCEILLDDSIAAGARARGLSRAIVYDRLADLRERAIGSGLGIYFPRASDSFETSSVCDQENVTAKQGDGEPLELPMLVAPRPTLRVTVAEMSAWVSSALAGERLEYFRGFLVIDRQPAGSRLGTRDRDELDRVADAAMALADAGRVHLVQRRHGNGDYSYLAVARSPRSTGGWS